MTNYRPRCNARLTVPVYGANQSVDQANPNDEVQNIFLHVRSATLTRNDHNTSDDLIITAEWSDCGIDPRFLRNAVVEFYMADTTESKKPGDPKFRGVATKVKRVAREGSGFSVDMEFRDYTQFFLAAKPYPSTGMPTYSNTLRDAWEKICDHTGWYDPDTKSIRSSVKKLRNRLQIKWKGFLVPESEWLTERGDRLGDVVSNRLAKLGVVPKEGHKDQSAWDVWKSICQMLGLITYIDGDTCVVTNTTEHYKTTNAPFFLWTKNIMTAEETVNAGINNHGVMLTSYNSLTNRILESFYPPPGDPRIKVPRAAANSKRFDPSAPRSEQYEPFEYHGIQSQELLDRLAKEAYEERSRQELEGSITTHEMSVDDIDLLTLRAGDAITVRTAPDLIHELVAETAEQQTQKLLDLGYSDDIARLILRNLSAYQAGTIDTTYHISRISYKLTEDTFEVDINYHNLIKVPNNAG